MHCTRDIQLPRRFGFPQIPLIHTLRQHNPASQPESERLLNLIPKSTQPQWQTNHSAREDQLYNGHPDVISLQPVGNSHLMGEQGADGRISHVCHVLRYDRFQRHAEGWQTSKMSSRPCALATACCAWPQFSSASTRPGDPAASKACSRPAAAASAACDRHPLDVTTQHTDNPLLLKC